MTNKPTERACETPLVELLESVPADARLSYEHSPTHHQMIQVGSLCHLAAASLRASTPQEPDCADCGQPHAEHRLPLAGSLLWCPGDAIRTYVAQEPDDDAEWLRSTLSACFFPGGPIRERLERIAARLQAKVPETGWQPIETAPKDGTRFLAWVHTAAGGRVTKVEWLSGQWVESYDLAAWMPEYGPTHWMPLPEPPNPPHSGIVDEADFTRGEE